MVDTSCGHFDPNALESTQESAVPAVVVDVKTCVEESLLVFPVAHGVTLSSIS